MLCCTLNYSGLFQFLLLSVCCFFDECDIASLVLGPDGGWTLCRIRVPGLQSKNFICTRASYNGICDYKMCLRVEFPTVGWFGPGFQGIWKGDFLFGTIEIRNIVLFGLVSLLQIKWKNFKNFLRLVLIRIDVSFL